MTRFAAADGVELAYRLVGDGEPVVCIPGGMLSGAYLGDLGGLSAYRQLVMLDLRGTGESGGPGDPENWRCDRLVPDLEALREHLGLERMTLLGHSAGASLVTRYAAEHPERIEKLVLATPGTRSVGIDMTADRRRHVLESRKDEPWYPEVSASTRPPRAPRWSRSMPRPWCWPGLSTGEPTPSPPKRSPGSSPTLSSWCCQVFHTTRGWTTPMAS